jgi:hypothetical protein
MKSEYVPLVIAAVTISVLIIMMFVATMETSDDMDRRAFVKCIEAQAKVNATAEQANKFCTDMIRRD